MSHACHEFPPVRAVFDANVLPTCRRSWQCSIGTSAAFVAFSQAAGKFERRKVPPFAPTNTRPVCPTSEYVAR